MKRVTNISATEEAAANLRREFASFEARPGEVFAQIYMFSYTNADGTPVDGFRPGFMAGSWPRENIGPSWFLASLNEGIAFYFWPRRIWDFRQRYLLAAVGPLFSIEPGG